MPKPDTSELKERVDGEKELKKLFVIATEDSKTGAYQYFSYLTILPEFRKFAFALEIIPSKDGLSSPDHVFDNVIESKNKKTEGGWFNPDEGDLYWIVCDVDSWKTEMIEKVIEDCTASRINCAFSNPCFEIWVLYHQETFDHDVSYPDSATCKAEANKLLEKRANGHEGLITRQQIRHAIHNAKSAQSGKKTRWPTKQGSDVYILAEQLI